MVIPLVQFLHMVVDVLFVCKDNSSMVRTVQLPEEAPQLLFRSRLSSLKQVK